MIVHLKIIGLLLMVLSLVHVGFYKYFKWKEEQASLSLINRQMMTVHTFFIALTVMLIGLLSFLEADALIHTELGKKISLGLGIFWVIRLFFQLFVYSPKLWKGKTFETIIHIIFSSFWGYMSYVYVSIYFN